MCHICIDICGFSLVCADFIYMYYSFCARLCANESMIFILWYMHCGFLLDFVLMYVYLYTLIYILLIYMYFAGPDYVLCRKICSLIGSLDADQEGFDQMPLLHHFDITAKMYLSQIDKYICLKLHNVFVSNCKTAD